MGPATAVWSRVYSRDAAGMDALRRDPGANDACRKNTPPQSVRAAPALGRRKLEPARGRYLPRLAGPRSALRWIDIGCGSGAFTEIDPPPNTHPMSALVRKRRFGRARYRLKSRQTADQKCLAKTRGGHRGGHMRLIFGAIVGRALHRVGPNSERFGYLQDTHTLRKLLSHLPSCR